ncbi:hypothetical protein GCM10027275_46300 [Rhabdobacter roseus]|uniref:Membrane or secreted protein n=1 Tax=Rhabdobacter roseus TaxID=1655419 RepID=A0A840U3K8_9BACT|nr:hypothetical protein [Rhabdobacter roseus]MBB5286700.1 hypothetical protein [Rhabdobacter roseus]
MKPLLTLLLALTLGSGWAQTKSIKGAWKATQPNNSTATMIVADNYLMIASYNVMNKYFDRTQGGPFTIQGNTLTYTPEFNTADTAAVGVPIVYTVERIDSVLSFKGEEPLVWMIVDDAANVDMAGTWHITERANDQGGMTKIHQQGTRKTLKILSKTRFQWAAIDPAVKGFYGTGGGTYTVKDGKYTERIEFFSRDNNRVGANLSFNWALKDGRWDHSGNSSTGSPIHEVWEKIK